MDTGHEAAGRDDCFADGSQAVDLNSRVSDISDLDMDVSAILAMEVPETKRRRIDSNPAAGTVRARELHGAWMQKANKRIEQENQKAAAIIFDKRVFNLAKQTAAGLAGIQVRWEMTSLANIIRDACRFREEGPSFARGNPKRLAELEKSLEIYDACLRYDVRAVARLLDCEIPRGPTFGKNSNRFEIQATMRE